MDVKARLATLGPHERASLLKRLTEERHFAAADRGAPLALSFPQRRLWFLRRLEGPSAAYNMPAAFRLRGQLDAQAVAAALREIVRRHEVLRTRLIEHDGEPVQVIDADVDPDGALVQMAAARDDDALRALIREHARRPFDLEREHPLRCLLIEVALDDHVLVVTVDHSASDGWSTGVLMREFAALYNAVRRGTSHALPDLPAQYADYAAWQHRELERADAIEPHVAYWRERLAGAPDAVGLPFDAPRRVGRAAAGDCVFFRIDGAAAAGISDLARAAGASTYMVLLAGFYALLHRWSGDTDITVGSPIANRPRKEFEGLIGFFVNTLALRTTLGGDLPFRTLVERVRGTALEAYAHADVPFELLVEKLNPVRRLDGTPFFGVMFAMQNSGLDENALDGVSVAGLPVTTGAARLDLTLSLQETPDGFDGCLEFSTALFRAGTAQRFVEHYRTLLASAVRDPQTPISRLDMLSRGELHRVLVEWNRTDATPERAACLHELIEAQAAATPEGIAIRHGDETWTYARLLAASARVARLLRERGVGPEVIVGVCMERTPALIVALLGVLRAGGAYVALDAAYPPARIRYTVEDSRAAIVLASRGVDPALFGAGPEIVVLADLDGNRDEPPLDPAPTVSSNLAYVLYTSGSTGRPKGVAIPHQGPVALVRWARSVWSRDELRGVLAATSICFDLSIFEMFVPLAVGGSVVLAANALELPTLAGREHVTLVNTVPSAIEVLVEQRGLPSGVRVVNLAGEALTRALADRLYAVPSVEKVYDLYGPSESTTYATFRLRERGEAASIGRPIADTRLYILDGALQPLPPGLPGEICLAGAGLARGYLGRPALTAEQFVPNPFTAGERLYRTGDVGRFRDDGSVEFLGRIDHQVKVRGFRIELGEIEAVLGELSGVGGAVVSVRTTGAGALQLAAHVAHPDGPGALPALEAHLRARLPEYMVPSLVVILDALPLSPNGKIDRAALPWPDGRAPRRDAAPLSAPERLLAAIWAELLHAERVARDDDFFALGGHSLLAARLASKVRDAFDVELPLRTIFEYPSLGAQSAAIAALHAGVPRVWAAIPRLDSRERLPLSFAQERLWFLDHLEPGNAAYTMPGALRLFGRLDIAALQTAFAQLVARHEVLRTVYPTVEGRASATLAAEPPVLNEVDLRPCSSAEQALRLETFLRGDAAGSFDLATGPLIRATALRLDDETVLAVTMHHIVSDGWSIDVFLRELCARYAALRGGGVALPVDEPVLQYADFAAWQRERFANGEMEPQLAYWREALAGAPQLLALPTDHPRPDAQSYRGAAYTTTTDAALMERVAHRARACGATPFMLLLAVYATLIARRSGADDLVIGFPAAGRTRSELEPLIGMFVNTIPLRLRFDRTATFEGVLAEVRARTLDALAHQDVPFEKLVDGLGATRSLSWSPLFQTMFVMQSSAEAPVLPAELRAEPIAPPSTIATKFDLTLAVGKGADGLALTFEYDTALFEETTIAGLAAEYVELLRRALDAPHEGPFDGAAAPTAPAIALDARKQDVADGVPASAAEIAIAGVWRDVLRLERVRTGDNFFELGGDSIVSIRVVAALRERGWRVDPKLIFRHQTIRALAAVAEPIGAASEAIEETMGRLALTPLQRLFFAHQPPTPSHFNQSLLLVLDPTVAPDALRAALRELQRVHPALRSRFRRDADGGWYQEIVAELDVALDEHDLGGDPPATRVTRLERLCDAVQRGLDLASGPLFRAVLFRLGANETRLLLVAHHLVVDAVSWRILLDELAAAYAQALRGRPALAAEACGPFAWRRRLAAWLRGDVRARERAYWATVTAHAGPVFAASNDPSQPSVAATLVRELSRGESGSLATAGIAGTGVHDLLLAALGRALCLEARRTTVVVDVEGHGRAALDDVDLSRSVGWFTTLYPVALACGASDDRGTWIDAAKRATRAIPHGGIGFGLLQSDDAAIAPHADVSFNFLGTVEAGAPSGLVRALAGEHAGALVAGDMPRRYRLECNAAVIDGRLVMQYAYDTAVLSEATVAAVADRALATLRALIADDEVDALLDELDLSELEQ